jgi:hypothetical protein
VRVLGEGQLPTSELADAAVTFYLGLNLLTHLDADRASEIFERLLAAVPAATGPR